MNSEIEQLHDMDTFAPLDDNKLTNKDRAHALASLMFLTEKRDIRNKGRTYANGRKQQSYIKIEDYVSPTVSLEAIMITSAI